MEPLGYRLVRDLARLLLGLFGAGAAPDRHGAPPARYAKDLALAGVTGPELDRTYPRAVVWRHAVREGAALLL